MATAMRKVQARKQVDFLDLVSSDDDWAGPRPKRMCHGDAATGFTSSAPPPPHTTSTLPNCDDRECWICNDETSAEVLISPCSVCTGSLGWVHTTCFKQWVDKAQQFETCPNCSTAYKPEVTKEFMSGRRTLEEQRKLQLQQQQRRALHPAYMQALQAAALHVPHNRPQPGEAGSMDIAASFLRGYGAIHDEMAGVRLHWQPGGLSIPHSSLRMFAGYEEEEAEAAELAGRGRQEGIFRAFIDKRRQEASTRAADNTRAAADGIAISMAQPRRRMTRHQQALAAQAAAQHPGTSEQQGVAVQPQAPHHQIGGDLALLGNLVRNSNARLQQAQDQLMQYRLQQQQHNQGPGSVAAELPTRPMEFHSRMERLRHLRRVTDSELADGHAGEPQIISSAPAAPARGVATRSQVNHAQPSPVRTRAQQVQQRVHFLSRPPAPVPAGDPPPPKRTRMQVWASDDSDTASSGAPPAPTGLSGQPGHLAAAAAAMMLPAHPGAPAGVRGGYQPSAPWQLRNAGAQPQHTAPGDAGFGPFGTGRRAARQRSAAQVGAARAWPGLVPGVMDDLAPLLPTAGPGRQLPQELQAPFAAQAVSLGDGVDRWVDDVLS